MVNHCNRKKGPAQKTEKIIEIYLVRLTEVCGKVLSEKYAYKFVKLLVCGGSLTSGQLVKGSFQTA